MSVAQYLRSLKKNTPMVDLDDDSVFSHLNTIPMSAVGPDPTTASDTSECAMWWNTVYEYCQVKKNENHVPWKMEKRKLFGAEIP